MSDVGGNWIRQKIVDNVESLLFPYRHVLQNAVFQQDNAQPRNTRVTLDRVEQVEVNLNLCHPKASDISLIENVWAVIGRNLPNLPHPSEPLEGFRHQI